MANSAFDHSPTITVPGSSTDTALVRWSGTGGKTFLDSTILVGATTMGLAADTDLLTFGNGTIAITGAITGVTTITATTFSGALSGNASGSAATLTNARTIGGVSFNGSANINLPGVNSAGNQNTSGTAAGLSATLVVASGGTNTTSYTKGDVLIASAGTTLTKLGIGTDDYVLTADASEATGVKWAAGGAGGASVIQMNDNVNIALGTGSDSILYYDGTDTIWRPKAVGSGQMRWQDTSGTMAYFETYGSQGPDIYIYHSKGSIGSHTSGVVASGERHGRIRFGASDGTAFHVGADIIGVANQNWLPAGDNDRGTRLEFYTTADDSASLSLAMTIADDGAITKPLQPAFYAVIPSGTNTNDISGDGTPRTILFDSTIFDQGGDFGANDTTFTAPVSGRYRFSVSLGEAGILSGHTDGRVTLNVENEQLRVDRHPWNGKNQGTTLGSFGINALVDMDANDTVTVIWQVGGSSRVCEIGGASAPHLAWFTGELVA